MILLADPGVICTGKQLADVLGIGARHVDKLVADHVFKPVRSRLRGKHFRLDESVQRYLAHQREWVKAQCASGSDEREILRNRKLAAEAERAELELELFKGQLHTSEVVLFVWSQRIGASKKRLLALPTRLAPSLVGETDQKKICGRLHDEISLALEDVSKLTTKDFEKQNRKYLEAHRSNGE
jgi:phage terminase Nu1 subunit (DNA packaging protein)